jgi:hypothetical protein
MPATRPRLIQLTGCRSAGSGLSVRWARRLSVRLHRPQSDPEARRHSLSRDPSGGESYAALMACWSRYAHVCRRSLWALDRNAGETLRTQLAGVDTSSQIATACLRHPSVGSGVFDICSRIVRHHKIAIATMVCARGSEYRQVECVMTLKCFTGSKQEPCQSKHVRRSPAYKGVCRVIEGAGGDRVNARAALCRACSLEVCSGSCDVPEGCQRRDQTTKPDIKSGLGLDESVHYQFMALISLEVLEGRGADTSPSWLCIRLICFAVP